MSKIIIYLFLIEKVYVVSSVATLRRDTTVSFFGFAFGFALDSIVPAFVACWRSSPSVVFSFPLYLCLYFRDAYKKKKIELSKGD